MFQKKEKRFEIKEEQGIGFYGSIQIVVDRVTGVNYILSTGESISGITPLLDENGNVVIDKISIKPKE